MRPIYREDGFDLDVDGECLAADLKALGKGAYELRRGDDVQRVFLAWDGDRAYVHLRGRTLEVRVVDALERVQQAARAGQRVGELTAPMPGVVVELCVAVGDLVEASDSLLVIESMKLRTTLQAGSDGRVAELPIALGQSFQRGDVLARVEVPNEGEGGP